MLSITRNPQESFYIETPTGEKIKIIIHSIYGNQASIGIDAPREYKIAREELLNPKFAEL